MQKIQSTDKVEEEQYWIQQDKSTIKLRKDINDGKKTWTIMMKRNGKRDLCKNHSAADPHPVTSFPHLS